MNICAYSRLLDASQYLHDASSTMEDNDYKLIVTTPTVQDENSTPTVQNESSNEATPTVQDESSNEATPTAQDENSDEATPLLATTADKNLYKGPIEHVDEQITFADIPMPGLWVKDDAGKNSDRIIILLFVLLASMIVVSYTYKYHKSS